MIDTNFAELVRRAKAGDRDAIDTLLVDFQDDLRIAVRRQLPRQLRRQFDSMDFVQLVWSSAFVGENGIDPSRFQSRQHLLGYLRQAARYKVLEEYRRRTLTRKYELGREEPLDLRRGDGEAPRSLVSNDPTPSEHLICLDRLEQLTAGRSALEAHAIRLRGEGLTFAEIAAETGLNERTIRRLIEEVGRWMEARQWR